MFIPLRTDCPLRRTPYVNYALIAANILVYVVQVMLNPSDPGNSPIVQQFILQPADPHLYQYVTYAFLHASIMHVGGNMLFLYIFGNNINDRLGHFGYLAFYLAGAIFAGIGYSLFSPAGMLGASGAVSAVTGAYLILLPRSNITVLYLIFFVGVAEIASLWFILLFFLLDLFEEIQPALFGGAQTVAHAAHISGTIFGAGLAALFLWIGLLPRDPFDVVALAQRWNRRRQYRDLVTKGFDPFGAGPAAGAYPSNASNRAPTPPDPRTLQLLDLRSRAVEAAAAHDLPRAVELYRELIAADANQVLPRQAQADIAHYLASEQKYAEAADAYEHMIRFYPTFDRLDQIYLMLGIISSRYLNRPEKAKEYLRKAIAGLHFSGEVTMAKEELAHLEGGMPGV